MRQVTLTVLAIFVLALDTPVKAQSVDDDGPVIAEAGDYITFFRKRLFAELGFASAQVGLGQIYRYGHGTEQDHQKALHWFQLAAEQGDTNAMKLLGMTYEKGEGVPKNYAKALRWYRLSAERGNAEVMNKLGDIYSNGDLVPTNLSESLRWYRLAAEQGNTNAQFNLGLNYSALHSRYNLDWDPIVAHMWFNVASANGSSEALEYRDIMARKLTSARLSEAQARATKCMESNYQDCD